MRIIFLLLLLPMAAFTQVVKINEYDKFIRQRRIELEPLPILATTTANVSLTYHCIGSTFYVILSGYGWGVSTISADDRLIFLLSNDSTVTARSTGLQSYEINGIHNTFKHQYFISLPDIEALSKYSVVAIRKYYMQDFADMKVSGQYADNVQKLSSTFLQELRKGRVLLTLQNINVNDISRHIGDSVRFCSKVYSTQRYFDSSENIPTVLNVGAKYPNQQLTAVISKEDRKSFGNAPEALYDKKDVCICGVVQLYKDKPQIVIHDREQITVKTPISLAEVAMYMGDSATVYGNVVSGEYFSDREDAPTLLNLGAAYPHQLLTVVIDGVDRKYFTTQPEKFYLNKDISITGKITSSNGKPQMVVHNKSQLTEISMHVAAAGAIQDGAPAKKIAKENRSAAFPGGQEAWKNFLIKSLVIPDDELDYGEKKTVVADISIGPDGTVDRYTITQSAGPVFDRQVISLLKKMPKWIPQIEDGKPVETTLKVPITFQRVANPSR